jgi:glycine oxidase
VKSWDVIIAGGGIVGVCTALELRRRGASVLVLDRGQPGQEASSAAAGMLAASDPETPIALREMASESARLYPDFVNDLQRVSGVTVDFRRQGTIVLGEEAPPLEYRRLSSDELAQLEPSLQTGDYPAFLVEEDSVDPVLLMRAAVAAANLSGVEISPGITVQSMHGSSSGVQVDTDKQKFEAGAALNCLGAWSGAPVKPRKGQMLYVQPARMGLLQHVVRAPGAYIVPRSSGKILIGTTVEDVGYDKSVDQETIRGMHRAASGYIPELATAPIVETWAGLRPGSPDDLPLIGRTEEQNVFVASGLFRNGILLAPMTARIAAALAMGQPKPIDISAFSPGRFATANA